MKVLICLILATTAVFGQKSGFANSQESVTSYSTTVTQGKSAPFTTSTGRVVQGFKTNDPMQCVGGVLENSVCYFATCGSDANENCRLLPLEGEVEISSSGVCTSLSPKAKCYRNAALSKSFLVASGAILVESSGGEITENHVQFSRASGVAQTVTTQKVSISENVIASVDVLRTSEVLGPPNDPENARLFATTLDFVGSSCSVQNANVEVGVGNVHAAMELSASVLIAPVIQGVGGQQRTVTVNADSLFQVGVFKESIVDVYGDAQFTPHAHASDSLVLHSGAKARKHAQATGRVSVQLNSVKTEPDVTPTGIAARFFGLDLDVGGDIVLDAPSTELTDVLLRTTSSVIASGDVFGDEVSEVVAHTVKVTDAMVNFDTKLTTSYFDVGTNGATAEVKKLLFAEDANQQSPRVLGQGTVQAHHVETLSQGGVVQVNTDVFLEFSSAFLDATSIFGKCGAIAGEQLTLIDGKDGVLAIIKEGSFKDLHIKVNTTFGAEQDRDAARLHTISGTIDASNNKLSYMNAVLELDENESIAASIISDEFLLINSEVDSKSRELSVESNKITFQDRVILNGGTVYWNAPTYIDSCEQQNGSHTFSEAVLLDFAFDCKGDSLCSFIGGIVFNGTQSVLHNDGDAVVAVTRKHEQNEVVRVSGSARTLFSFVDTSMMEEEQETPTLNIDVTYGASIYVDANFDATQKKRTMTLPPSLLTYNPFALPTMPTVVLPIFYPPDIDLDNPPHPNDPASSLPTGTRKHKPVHLAKPVDGSRPLLYGILQTSSSMTINLPNQASDEPVISLTSVIVVEDEQQKRSTVENDETITFVGGRLKCDIEEVRANPPALPQTYVVAGGASLELTGKSELLATLHSTEAQIRVVKSSTVMVKGNHIGKLPAKQRFVDPTTASVFVEEKSSLLLKESYIEDISTDVKGQLTFDGARVVGRIDDVSSLKNGDEVMLFKDCDFDGGVHRARTDVVINAHAVNVRFENVLKIPYGGVQVNARQVDFGGVHLERSEDQSESKKRIDAISMRVGSASSVNGFFFEPRHEIDAQFLVLSPATKRDVVDTVVRGIGLGFASGKVINNVDAKVHLSTQSLIDAARASSRKRGVVDEEYSTTLRSDHDVLVTCSYDEGTGPLINANFEVRNINFVSEESARKRVTVAPMDNSLRGSYVKAGGVMVIDAVRPVLHSMHATNTLIVQNDGGVNAKKIFISGELNALSSNDVVVLHAEEELDVQLSVLKTFVQRKQPLFTTSGGNANIAVEKIVTPEGTFEKDPKSTAEQQYFKNVRTQDTILLAEYVDVGGRKSWKLQSGDDSLNANNSTSKSEANQAMPTWVIAVIIVVVVIACAVCIGVVVVVLYVRQRRAVSITHTRNSTMEFDKRRKRRSQSQKHASRRLSRFSSAAPIQFSLQHQQQTF